MVKIISWPKQTYLCCLNVDVNPGFWCDSPDLCTHGSFRQRKTGQEWNKVALRAQIFLFSKLFSMCTNPMDYILTNFCDTMLSDYKTRFILLFAASYIGKIDLLHFKVHEYLNLFCLNVRYVNWRASVHKEKEFCVLFCFVFSTTIQSVQFPQWTESTKIQERNCQWMNEEIFYRMAGSENLYLQCMVMRCYSLSETTYVCERDCLQLFSWKNKSYFENNC